jgi:hypothetical protein
MSDARQPVEPTEDDPDTVPSPEDPTLTEYDKTLADSFPSSDPPAMP